jgi:hypothetical protein
MKAQNPLCLDNDNIEPCSIFINDFWIEAQYFVVYVPLRNFSIQLIENIELNRLFV